MPYNYSNCELDWNRYKPTNVTIGFNVTVIGQWRMSAAWSGYLPSFLGLWLVLSKHPFVNVFESELHQIRFKCQRKTSVSIVDTSLASNFIIHEQIFYDHSEQKCKLWTDIYTDIYIVSVVSFHKIFSQWNFSWNLWNLLKISIYRLVGHEDGLAIRLADQIALLYHKLNIEDWTSYSNSLQKINNKK